MFYSEALVSGKGIPWDRSKHQDAIYWKNKWLQGSVERLWLQCQHFISEDQFESCCPISNPAPWDVFGKVWEMARVLGPFHFLVTFRWSSWLRPGPALTVRDHFQGTIRFKTCFPLYVFSLWHCLSNMFSFFLSHFLSPSILSFFSFHSLSFLLLKKRTCKSRCIIASIQWINFISAWFFHQKAGQGHFKLKKGGWDTGLMVSRSCIQPLFRCWSLNCCSLEMPDPFYY